MALGVDPADRVCRIEQFALHSGRDVLTFGNLLKSVGEAGLSLAEAKFLRKRAVEVAAAAVAGAAPGFGGHIAALDLAVAAAGVESVSEAKAALRGRGESKLAAKLGRLSTLRNSEAHTGFGLACSIAKVMSEKDVGLGPSASAVAEGLCIEDVQAVAEECGVASGEHATPVFWADLAAEDSDGAEWDEQRQEAEALDQQRALLDQQRREAEALNGGDADGAAGPAIGVVEQAAVPEGIDERMTEELPAVAFLGVGHGVQGGVRRRSWYSCHLGCHRWCGGHRRAR
jgi:hypothetical protein